MAGALVASALSPRLATPAQAAMTPYDLAMSDVLGSRASWDRPSWEMDLERLRAGGLISVERLGGERLAQAAAPQRGAQTTFNIPAGPLSEVIPAFEAATGLRVSLAESGLRQIQSPGVTGSFNAEAALTIMLEGTGISGRINDGVAVLEVQSRSEFVEVTGSAAPIASMPKFTEPLRNIPQTVTVITSDVIQAQGITSLRDVLRNVPGVTFQAGEGGGGLPGDTFTMRGFSSRNDLFIDGIRDSGGYSRDAFNLEQVEVIKGPSSSIAGRGATGGAVNQVTKTPNLTASQGVSFGFGDADYRRGTADINQPIEALADNAAFRLNAMWTDSGVPGRNVVENKSWGVAPSMAFGLGTPTQITLKYQHLTQDNVPDYGLPWGVYPGYPTGAFDANPPVDQSNFYGLEDYDFEDIASDVATLDIHRELPGGMSLRNATRYSQTDRSSAITAPRPPNRQLQRRDMGNTNIANQTNLGMTLGRGAVQHDVSTGLEFSRERTRNQNSAQATNQPPTTVANPNPRERPFGPMPANTGNPSRTVLNQAGIYVFDTMRIGERWQFSGGLRYDIVDTDYELTTLATGVVTSLTGSDKMLSWRGGVVYKPEVNGSIYLGFGTSFDPSVDAAATGAALSNAPTSANNPSLEPEETSNYEVGTKWDLLEGRLSLNGAVFHTEKRNARTRNATTDPFVLTGRQEVTGAEVGVSGQITPAWSALMTYAFMSSEIAASANAAEEGQNLTLTPESTFSLWTTYQVTDRLTGGIGAQYMDAVFRNTLNTQVVPSYWLANALVSYEVNRNLTLRLNSQNFTDEQYVDRVGGGHYIPGPRRQVQLSADVSF